MTEIIDAELSLVNAEVNYKMYFCVLTNDKLLISLQGDNFDYCWQNSFTLDQLRHFDTFDQMIDQVISYPEDVKITFENSSD